MDRFGYDEQGAEGDGNCQFRSLAQIFHQRQSHYAFVRSKIVQELRDKPDFYWGIGHCVYDWLRSKINYNKYVNEMSQDGHWGDVVTLHAAANLYHVRILTFSSSEKEVILEVCPNDGRYKKDVYLSYCYKDEEEAHYNPAYLNTEMPAVDPNEASPSDVSSSLGRFRSSKNNVRLYVSNIPYTSTGSSLRRKFASYGSVLSSKVEYWKDGQSLGYGFVVMKGESDAKKVMNALNFKEFEGRKILINLANDVVSPYDYLD